jgi:hypothetical protein
MLTRKGALMQLHMETGIPVGFMTSFLVVSIIFSLFLGLRNAHSERPGPFGRRS